MLDTEDQFLNIFQTFHWMEVRKWRCITFIRFGISVVLFGPTSDVIDRLAIAHVHIEPSRQCAAVN